VHGQQRVRLRSQVESNQHQLGQEACQHVLMGKIWILVENPSHGWEMPELNGGFNGIVQQAMFDYR
jgi:hypothetical protein